MFSDEDKINIAKEYVNGPLGLKKLAKKYNIKSYNSIKNWVIKFNIKSEHNAITHNTKKYNSTYSGTFKRTVVKYFLEHDDYIYETANKFNISTTTLQKWIKDYNNSDIIIALKDKNGEFTSMSKANNDSDAKDKLNEQLLIENERLRAEVEYLKKLNALTQEKLKLKPLKKSK